MNPWTLNALRNWPIKETAQRYKVRRGEARAGAWELLSEERAKEKKLRKGRLWTGQRKWVGKWESLRCLRHQTRREVLLFLWDFYGDHFWSLCWICYNIASVLGPQGMWDPRASQVPLVVKNTHTCQHRRHKRCGFNPWVQKIPWRRQPSPLFLPEESHGQRSPVSYSP